MASRRKSRSAGRTGLVVLALVAGACGGGAGGGGSNKGGATATTSSHSAPQAGGSLTIATEAEVQSGFDPFNSDWDATGLSYASTVYDSLMALGADGTFKPNLAQSVTPNADFTSWTIVARPNISFSDGEPFNADAIVADFNALLKSTLTGPILYDIASVTKTDDMTVTVALKPRTADCPTCGSWADFPSLFAEQFGFMVAPKAINDPNLKNHPVGTGPFVFQSWVPGDHFTATKNPNYWRKDANGVQLPYLDSVTFKPVPDALSRKNSLISGTIDMMHTTDTQTILDLRGNHSVSLIEAGTGRVEQDFVMLNTSKPPLDDIRVREALAMALDRNRYNQFVNNGILKVADGPFSPGSGFDNAGGYPAYNPTMAKQLIQQYEADKHVSSVQFEFGNTNTSKNLQDNNLIADMWSQIGVKATVRGIDQSSYVANALVGNFQAYAWRQWSEPDPDTDFIWWGSRFANPPLVTNFARNQDPKIDAAMIDARSTTDPTRRKTDYTAVSAQLNKDLPYLWEAWVDWSYAAKPSVQGVAAGTLPDGSTSRPVWGGVIVPTQLWLSH